MSFKSTVVRIFRLTGSVVEQAWKLVKKAGLDDDLMQFALKYVRSAETKYVDNAERREWVVQALVDRKVPEYIARILVELAVRVLKAELKKAGV